MYSLMCYLRAKWLNRDVSSQEIKSAMFQMHPDKASGPDGYNA